MSHHSREYDQQMKEQASKFIEQFENLGPTGEFPQGHRM